MLKREAHVRDGAKINYEAWGETRNPVGPWLTLINGNTRPLNDFRLLGRHLEDAGARILALDNRGAGKTEISRAFTMQEMSDDVASLWQLLGIQESIVLGISMGGFIAQNLAHKWPQNVRKLILISTAANAEMIRRDGKAWSSDPIAVEQKLRPYFSEGFAERNAGLIKSMVKQIASSVSDSDFSTKGAMQLEAVKEFNHLPWLHELAMPTLIIHGEVDRIIPAQAATTLARYLPQARLELLAGAGHLLLAEKPRELYELVRGFMD